MIDSILSEVVGRGVLSLIGRLCLYVRFRNKYKVRKELITKYDKSFSMAGVTLIWLLVAWVLLIALSIGLIVGFYSIIKNLF